ncbi:MAG: dipeptide epimerase [Defluviitaleaceae bacterium]|nr:dipeptide epimerase [Defluviitaleaceae bacterium]
MKITDIRYDRLTVKLKEPFVISLGVIEYAETMIVKITTDEGIVGFGEASPYAPVTGETLETVPVFLDMFKNALIGENPFELEKIHKIMDKITVGGSSAKASIDIALYDIIGKKLDMPVYQVLGGYRDRFLTDMTVGISSPFEMAQTAMGYVTEGFQIIKVKAGINPEEDIAAIRAIRKTVGDDIKIRVDANQGWDVNTAIQVINIYEEYGVDAVEQPLPYWDIDGLAYVRDHVKLKIMADESLHTPMDAMKLAKKEAVDIFNIKLMKSAGLYPALRINAIGESCGIPCMLGCMLETRLGIAASASLVAAQKNIIEADLDSFRHYDDGVVSGGFVVEDGMTIMLDKPGLGIELNF